MLPLPFTTKENYKVLFYRLVDLDADKVNDFLLHFPIIRNTILFLNQISNSLTLPMQLKCFLWLPMYD